MSNMSRQPRKLHYLKCNRCRADRQKCTPTDRPWPGPKCHRCAKFKYPCSANVTTRGDLGGSSNVSQPSQGSQQVPPLFNIEDFGKVQPDPLDFHAIRNLLDTAQSFAAVSPAEGPLAETCNPFDAGNAGQSFPAASPMEPPLAEKPPRDEAIPGCARFFVMLQRARWDPTDSRPPVLLPPIGLAFYTATMMEELLIARELYLRLRRRELLVETSRQQEVKIQQEIAKGMSRDKAVKVITTDTIAGASKKHLPGNDMQLSPVEHVMVFAHMLREGERWRELVDAVGAREILLMDANHPECLKRSGGIRGYSKSVEVITLECCSAGDPSLSVERIMTRGTDEVFAKLKETVLAPELQLKLTCQRLSGLVDLIYRLFQRDEQDDPLLKWFSTPIYHLTRGTFKDELSHLDSFLISEIPRRIQDVFGSDRPLPSLWRDDPSTSDDDDDNDDGGDDDDDDDDNDNSGGPFQNDTLVNNEEQNNADSGEDFCIHFGSTNPFSSL